MTVFEELREGKSYDIRDENISVKLTAKWADAGISAGR